jgi:hypothetical protein
MRCVKASTPALALRLVGRGDSGLDNGGGAMLVRYIAICTVSYFGAVALPGASANALSLKECRAKYKAIEDTGTLNGIKWKDFRKAQCSAEASATPQSGRPHLVPHSGGGR